MVFTAGQSAQAAPTEQTKTEPSKKIVTVQPGDYLVKLAEAYDTKSERIFFANTEIANPDLIYPDQKLRIPNNDERLTPRDIPVNQVITPAPASAPASAAAAAPRPQQQVAQAAPAPTGSGCEWLSGRLAANGLSASEISYALPIASRESGCNPQAVNRTSGACNVFQEYTCGKWGGRSNVDAHIRGADGYAKARYGSWAGAYSFWQANKWW